MTGKISALAAAYLWVAIFSQATYTVLAAADDDSCPDSAGESYYPHPTNCNQYYECVNGVTILETCPEDLFWNDVLDICDFLENVDCSRGTRTTPSEDGRDPECLVDSPGIIFIPDPNDCSQYYECSDGYKYLEKCAAGLYWNDALHICDYPANVDCSRSNQTSSTSTQGTPTATTPTTLTTPTTTTIGTIVTTVESCSDSAGESYYPHPTNCNQYYECVNGVTILETCPEDLFWNDILDICDFLENVDCSRGTRTTPSEDGRDPECLVDSPGIIFIPDPNDCSQYYECSDGYKYLEKCAAGLNWNDVLHICDYPANVDCSRSNQTSTTSTQGTPTATTPTTLTTPTTTTIGTIVTTVESCSDSAGNSYYPHPTNCNQYYECINGITILETCPEDLFWNDILEICDFLENVDCSRGTRTTPSEDGRDPECLVDSPGIIFIPDPNDCSQYYECSDGYKYLEKCAAGLNWNDVLHICDYPANVDCSRSNQTTATSTQGTPTATPATIGTTVTTVGDVTTNGIPDEACLQPSEGIIYIPHPVNCNQYYECSDGLKFLETCPTSLVWNTIYHICDYPYNVDCSRSNSTVIPSTTQVAGSVSISPAIDCPVEGTSYQADPEHCNQYYQCTNGVAVLETCPDGRFWNERTNECDYLENVNCNRVSTESTASTETTPTTPSTTTTQKSLCPSEGTSYVPDPEHCNQYYECVDGEATLQTCPENKYWNDRTEECDYLENVNCNRVTTTTPGDGPTNPTNPTGPSGQLCQNEPDGAFIRDPDDCSKYIECLDGEDIVEQCGDGTLWNEDNLTCDFPENVNCP